jgi:hypothetical protein
VARTSRPAEEEGWTTRSALYCDDTRGINGDSGTFGQDVPGFTDVSNQVLLPIRSLPNLGISALGGTHKIAETVCLKAQ